MMDVMAAPRISPDERRDRLVELVSVLGDCPPTQARHLIREGDTNLPVDLTVDPSAFRGCDDPWGDVAVALVALRR